MGDQPQGRLLVVDFDFFFHNPLQGAQAPHRGDPLLYDWAHADNRFLRETVWAFRVEPFLDAGAELPRCEDYEGFWDRFTFTSASPPMFYADSNVYAGRLTPAHYGLFDCRVTTWQEVHLFDAHHDSGYPQEDGPQDFEQWWARGTASCEDWMLTHHARGTRLAHTYPAWRPDPNEPAPMVPVLTAVDDRTRVPDTFDAVFLCRSGAWVPSWCDDQFTELLKAFPGESWLFPAGDWTHPRPDVVPAARRMIALRAALRERAAGADVPPKTPAHLAGPAPRQPDPPGHPPGRHPAAGLR